MNSFNFTENINVGLMESFDDNNQKVFRMVFEPSQNCHCKNKGELIYSFIKLGNSFNINLQEIQIPKDCNDKYGTPFADVILGSLSNGIYNIQVNTKSNYNAALLTVTDTAYHVTMNIQENLNLFNSNYRRVFDNTLWGALCYNTDSELKTGLSLIDSLTSLGARPTTLKDGDYSFFSIKNGKAILPLAFIVPHLYPGKEIAFAFDYSFADEKLTSLLTKYIYTSGDLYIMVRTGKGFRFYNWR
jgi:hypothetical protein